MDGAEPNRLELAEMELTEMELSEMASSDPFGMGTRSPLAGVPGGPSVRPETALGRWNAEDRSGSDPSSQTRYSPIYLFWNIGTLFSPAPGKPKKLPDTLWHTWHTFHVLSS